MMMRTPRIPLLVSLIFFILFTIPIFYLVIGSLLFEVGSVTLTYEALHEVILSHTTGPLFINTLVFALGGASLATLLGSIYAWIIVRTDVPGKRILELLPILPLTMPFLVKSFAWIFLFSPRIGLINLAFTRFFGLDQPIFNIFTMEGMVFAIGVGGLPLTYLTIEAAIRSIDPALEEASRVMGSGLLKTFLKVTVPVLLPAILSAFLLMTIIGLENFDYPFMLGGPGGINTLATEVYYYIYQHLPPKYGTAAIISIVFLVLTFTAFSVYVWITRKAFRFVVVTGKVTQQTVHKLRAWKYFALAVCLFILLLSFFLPFSTLLLMSMIPFYTVTGGYAELRFTFENYIEAINLPLFYQAFGNSLTMSLVSSILVTFIAALMSYAALKSKVKGARLIEYVSSIPLAFPGIVYGLAIFWTFLMLPGVSDLLYGTIWPLVIAIMVIRLPYSVRIVSGNLIQLADELEEASRVSGASWGKTFNSIVLPLLGRGLANSFIYTFINSLRELGTVVLLVTPQSLVLTVLLLNLYSQHAAALNIVAAASVMISMVIAAVLVASRIIERTLVMKGAR